jgi:hypothetical protein
MLFSREPSEMLYTFQEIKSQKLNLNMKVSIRNFTKFPSGFKEFVSKRVGFSNGIN